MPRFNLSCDIKLIVPDLYRQAARNLTNETGKLLQAQIWKEVLQIFDAAALPEASKIARSKL